MNRLNDPVTINRYDCSEIRINGKLIRGQGLSVQSRESTIAGGSEIGSPAGLVSLNSCMPAVYYRRGSMYEGGMAGERQVRCRDDDDSRPTVLPFVLPECRRRPCPWSSPACDRRSDFTRNFTFLPSIRSSFCRRLRVEQVAMRVANGRVTRNHLSRRLTYRVRLTSTQNGNVTRLKFDVRPLIAETSRAAFSKPI